MPVRNRRPALGAAGIVVAALLWAVIGPIAEPLLDRGLEPAEIAFWRAAIGGGCFLVHALVTRARPPRAAVPLLVAFGVVGVGLFYASLPAAIDAGGVSIAWLLLYTAPAWVALAAPIAIGERTDRRTGVLVGLTVAGVALVALGGGTGVRIGVASVGWGLVAGLSYATWYLVTQRTGTTPVATGAVAIPIGAAALGPFATWPGSDLTTWFLLVALGTVSTYLPAMAYYHGIAHVPAARASVLATVEPVAALVFAAVLFDERLAAPAVAGAVIVVAAAAFAARER